MILKCEKCDFLTFLKFLKKNKQKMGNKLIYLPSFYSNIFICLILLNKFSKKNFIILI